MINQRTECAKVFQGTTLILVFFFFISFFSIQPLSQTAGTIQYSIKSELCLCQANAAVLDLRRLANPEDRSLFIIYNETINLFNKSYKIFSDNNRINQMIILVQKTEILVKTLLPIKFCYRTIHNKELPI